MLRKDEEKDKIKKEEQRRDQANRQPINEGITFLTCPTHGVQYPRGGSCPQCKNR